MLHVRLDQVAGSEGRHERELARHDGCANDTGETLSVGARGGSVGAGDTEHFEHGALGGEDGASADGADFDGRHCAGHQQVLAVVDAVRQSCSVVLSSCTIKRHDSRFHQSHTVARLDILRGILTSGEVDRLYNQLFILSFPNLCFFCTGTVDMPSSRVSGRGAHSLSEY